MNGKIDGAVQSVTAKQAGRNRDLCSHVQAGAPVAIQAYPRGSLTVFVGCEVCAKALQAEAARRESE